MHVETPPARPVLLRIEGVVKRFGEQVAVDGVSLDIFAGEFCSLLGPSGCGKTTLLRLIAGFEAPDAGRLMLNGQDLAPLPAHKRPVNTVFQHYALFPHLSVFENVAFGLRRQRTAEDEIQRRVRESLALVRLEGFEGRAPHQMSGGQKQRVALARALVLRPQLLLLDEPLGALDHQLRLEMQVELKELQRSTGITFLFVTHDQPEALTMSDRVAVMNRGHVEQLGGSDEVYERPRTGFVARFLGASNLIRGRVVAVDEQVAVQLDGGSVARFAPPATPLAPGAEVEVMIRPEWLVLSRAAPGPGTIGARVRVEARLYQGAVTRWTVSGLGAGPLEVTGTPLGGGAEDGDLRPGETGWLCWRDGVGALLPVGSAS